MEVAKGGYREDLKKFFRSKMEANVCRYYKYTGELSIYEHREFEFKGIKRGSRFYKPDFYLPIPKRWIEVKGWFRKTDKTKLRRFKKYYPEEFFKLKFIIPDKYARDKANGEMIKFICDDLGINFEEIISYKEIEKYGGLIPRWE